MRDDVIHSVPVFPAFLVHDEDGAAGRDEAVPEAVSTRAWTIRRLEASLVFARTEEFDVVTTSHVLDEVTDLGWAQDSSKHEVLVESGYL